MRLNPLPDTRTVDLSSVWIPGLQAVVRPADPVDVAKWHDGFPSPEALNEKALGLARERLLRVECADGSTLTIGDADERFDVANPVHFAAIPFPALLAIYQEAVRGPDRPTLVVGAESESEPREISALPAA
jgi:hypothetical protein